MAIMLSGSGETISSMASLAESLMAISKKVSGSKLGGTVEIPTPRNKSPNIILIPI